MLLVDVFHGSLITGLLAQGASQVWVSRSARAARIKAGNRALLFGEQEGLPPEGFHYGTSLQGLERLQLEGRECVLLSPALAQALDGIPLESLLGHFRNARASIEQAVQQKIYTLVAASQGWLEPSLTNTVAAGFLAQRLHQHLGQWGELQDGARMANALLKSFPDPQEALLQSDLGKGLFRSGHSEDIALTTLISVENSPVRLAGLEVLEAKTHGLSKDRPVYGFRLQ